MNIRKLIDEFYQKLIYGKLIRKMNLNDAIEICIHKAYLTICRSLKGIGKTNKTYIKILKNALSNLLTNSKVNFDDWHKKVCNDIINSYSINKKLNINYGIAQKLVNITIKYLFCIINDSAFTEKNMIVFNDFDNCHATLDSNILAEIKKFSSKIKISTLSQINTYQDYMDCQNEIRNHLQNSNNNQISPFIWEFEIWNELINKSNF